MIVGTAYVEIHAVTDKVRGEIRKGMQSGMAGTGTEAGQEFDREVAPEIEKTGEKMRTTMRSKASTAGDEAGQSFAQKFKSKISQIPDMMKGTIGQASTKQGEDFGIKFWKGVQNKTSSMKIRGILLGGLTSFIPAAVSLIGELGGGLVALGSAAGQAAGAMPALYSNMVPVMTMLGGFKLGLSGIGAALKATMSGTATPAALAKAMKPLGPEAQQFVKYVGSLKPQLDALKRTAASNLLPGLEAGIKGVMPLLPAFQRMIGQTNRALGNTVAGIGQMLGGQDAGLMRSIMTDNVKSVTNLTGAMRPLVDAFLRVYHAMQPVQIQMTALVKRGAEWLDASAKSAEATGRLAAYFQRSFDRAKQLGDILHNIATVVLNVGKAASAAGGTMLTSIDDVTKRWASFTGQASTQNSMRDWFNQTIPVMHEFVGIIGDIMKDIARLGGSNKDLLPLLTQIRTQLVPALNNLLQATTGPVAQSMIALLTDLVNILAKISAGGSTGFLNSFVRSLDAVARVLNTVLSIPGVGHLAGILGGIAGSVAAFSFVAGKLKIFGMAAGLLGFGKAAKTASLGVDALKLSKMSEAEKLAENETLALRNAGAYGKMKNAIKALIGGEGLAGLKKALGRGGAAGGLEAGAEGAAGGGVMSKIGGMLKGPLSKVGGAVGIGAAAEGGEAGGLAALFGGEATVPVIGEIAIAVTALGVGIYEMVKHWDAVKGFFTKTLPNALGTAAGAVGRWFAGLPDMVGRFMSAIPGVMGRFMKAAGLALIQATEWAIAGAIVWFAILPVRIGEILVRLSLQIPGWIKRAAVFLANGIRQGVDDAVHWLAGLPGRAASAIGGLAGQVRNIAHRAANWLGSEARGGVSDAVTWFKRLPGRAASGISNLPGALRSIVSSAGSRMVSAARTGVSNTVKEVKRLPGQIKDGIGDLGHILYDAGKSILSGLYNGVVDGVKSFGGGIISKIHSFTSHIPGMRGSPSLDEMAPSLLTRSGREIMQSMTKGVEQEANSGALIKQVHAAVGRLSGVSGPTLNAQFAAQVAGTTGGSVAPAGTNFAALLHVENLVVRDDRDITNLEQMLYRASQNVGRANGQRVLPGQKAGVTP